jgi:hypothetical protein
MKLAYLDRLAPDPLTDDGDLKLDVVIPVALRDSLLVKFALEGLQRNLRNDIGRVVLVAPAAVAADLRGRHPGVEVLDEEDLFDAGFRRLVAERFGARAGWMMQQLLTLSTPELSSADAALQIDADTILIRPRRYRSGSRTLLLAAPEFHPPYFDALGRLWKRRARLPLLSYIGHHMCFLREEVLEMRSEIERRWRMPWYEAVVSACDPDEPSGFSDYELYGQWRAKTRRSRCAVRTLRNVGMDREALVTVRTLERDLPPDVFSVSCHWYISEARGLR